MKIFLFFLIFVLLCNTAFAEVGPIITFSSTTNGSPIPVMTHSGGGSSGSNRNSNNCDTRVNATNLNTGLCGEYSVCYLPPRYSLVTYCVQPTKYRDIAPVGTYDRRAIVENDTSESVGIVENISEVPEPVVENTVNDTIIIDMPEKKVEESKMWVYLMWLGIILVLLIFLGLIIYYSYIKDKKEERRSTPKDPLRAEMEQVIQPMQSYQQHPSKPQVVAIKNLPDQGTKKISENSGEDWRDTL